MLIFIGLYAYPPQTSCVLPIYVARYHFYIFSISQGQNLNKAKAKWEMETLELLLVYGNDL